MTALGQTLHFDNTILSLGLINYRNFSGSPAYRVFPLELLGGHVLVVGHVEDICLRRGPESGVSGVLQLGFAQGVSAQDGNHLKFVPLCS